MHYTESHEWIAQDGEEGTVGISQYAQEELGEIVHIELPKVGQAVEAGEEIAVVESTKAAADIYSPVSGKVTAINEEVVKNPALLNTDAEGRGWLYRIACAKPDQVEALLTKERYAELIR